LKVKKQNPKPGLIIHTDCGSQYTGYRFYEAINQNRCVHSHSRKGNPYDNALMESFYRSFKREVFPDKQYQTRTQALLETLDYLESYYNEKRIHSSLNYHTPNDFSDSTNPSFYDVSISLEYYHDWRLLFIFYSTPGFLKGQFLKLQDILKVGGVNPGIFYITEKRTELTFAINLSG